MNTIALSARTRKIHLFASELRIDLSTGDYYFLTMIGRSREFSLKSSNGPEIIFQKMSGQRLVMDYGYIARSEGVEILKIKATPFGADWLYMGEKASKVPNIVHPCNSELGLSVSRFSLLLGNELRGECSRPDYLISCVIVFGFIAVCKWCEGN